MTWYESAQTVIAFATLPVTAYFLFLFAKPSERWWATPFGRSLMLLAVGVFLYSSATVMWRLFGDYPWRPFMLLGATGSAFVAMLIRTVVLHNAQKTEREDLARVNDPEREQDTLF